MIEVFAVKVPARLNKFLFRSLMREVSPVKRKRIMEYQSESDRIRGLFSDLLIRSIIRKKTGLKNEEISFGTNEYGKPYLEGRDDLHFNLSHSGIWVVAAVDNNPVGVDVEEVRDIDLCLAEEFFSEDEHNDLMEKSDKLSYFFTLWTLKESYIKIIGKGLSQPLDSFSIRFATRDKIVVKTEGKTVDGLVFSEYNLHNDYKMVLCGTHDKLPEEVNMRNVEQLVREFVA
ncbi:MAG: 4'-phosphopantetheinyl transferase superfamily protein [bacterium]|nr:4'-phosphopantetheinyl transferase superfamily protein [bacterium]